MRKFLFCLSLKQAKVPQQVFENVQTQGEKFPQKVWIWLNPPPLSLKHVQTKAQKVAQNHWIWVGPPPTPPHGTCPNKMFFFYTGASLSQTQLLLFYLQFSNILDLPVSQTQLLVF